MTKSTGKRPSRGIRNCNPLNIRLSSQNHWVGKRYDNTDGVFEQFMTMRHGIRAAYVLLSTYYYGYKLQTIASIVRKWAPPMENDTSAYIKHVSERCHLSATGKLLPEDLPLVGYEMAQIESGKEVATYRNDFVELGQLICVRKVIPDSV